MIEMVEDRGVDGGEFLERSHPPKAQHRPLPSSKGLVRVLSAIVLPTTGLLFVADAEVTQCRPIGAQAIRHDLISSTMAFDHFPEEFQCCFFSRRLVTTLSRTSPS